MHYEMVRPEEGVRELLNNQRAIIEWHKNWPILVETPPKFEPNFSDDYAANINQYTMHMSQEIAWLTQEEYVKRFGRQPPTAPLLKQMAQAYSDHPDFDESW